MRVHIDLLEEELKEVKQKLGHSIKINKEAQAQLKYIEKKSNRI